MSLFSSMRQNDRNRHTKASYHLLATSIQKVDIGSPIRNTELEERHMQKSNVMLMCSGSFHSGSEMVLQNLRKIDEYPSRMSRGRIPIVNSKIPERPWILYFSSVEINVSHIVT